MFNVYVCVHIQRRQLAGGWDRVAYVKRSFEVENISRMESCLLPYQHRSIMRFSVFFCCCLFGIYATVDEDRGIN